ncbi:MAG: nickel pincer cofactor biosynthesis protein LarB [Rhodospirillales bacterium]|jgi:hypothetical protein|nr:nickel pincer cofactor biosynthesis protein LarB [Rhodospirillales bacterium]
MTSVHFDWRRTERSGLPEAVFCASKSADQIGEIVNLALGRKHSLLLTKLTEEAFEGLAEEIRARLDHDSLSGTAILDCGLAPATEKGVCVVAAGTSDMPVAAEARRTLGFHGIDAPLVCDVGVAGLWRLMERIDEIRRHRVVIAVAGMEGALFSVLGGLVPGLVIAVPTSVGYGVAEGGRAALKAALASCVPGVVVVNIDNGYGAAAAAVKIEALRGAQ